MLSALALQSHGIAKAADKPEILEAAAMALSGWCDAVDLLLAEADARTCVGLNTGLTLPFVSVASDHGLLRANCLCLDG